MRPELWVTCIVLFQDRGTKAKEINVCLSPRPRATEIIKSRTLSLPMDQISENQTHREKGVAGSVTRGFVLGLPRRQTTIACLHEDFLKFALLFSKSHRRGYRRFISVDSPRHKSRQIENPVESTEPPVCKKCFAMNTILLDPKTRSGTGFCSAFYF